MGQFKEIERLIFSGNEENILRAFRMAENQEIDAGKIYRQLQETIDFFEQVKKQLYSISTLCRGVEKEGLELANCQLKALPNCLVVLNSIVKTIHLSGNQFHQFPKVLEALEQVEVLDLSANSIAQIPGAINQLKKIKELQLKGNPLLRVPREIFQLKQLQQLSISIHYDSIFPDGIQQLSNLVALDLELLKNGLLPSLIFKCKSLETLQLRGDALYDIGDDLGALTELKSLSICNAPNLQLPDAFDALEALRVLKLTGLKHLEKIPESIYQMSSLEQLDLSRSLVDSISPSIRKMKNLVRLNLKETGLLPTAKEQWAKRLAVWVPACRITWD